MKYTKLIENENEEYTIEKDKQYVIDCTIGGGELKIIGKVNKHESGMLYKNYYAIGDAIDKLGEYEDSEEKGLLLKLPCKIGNICWVISYVLEHYAEEPKYIVQSCEYNLQLYENNIEVFLTKEDAEKRLIYENKIQAT